MARETKFGRAARAIREGIVPVSLPYCYERDQVRPWKWIRVRVSLSAHRQDQKQTDLVDRLMKLAAKVR
jgi:hypothetical protein